MSSTKRPLSDELIQELTEWALQQFIAGIQQGKLNVKKIVCRLLREGQRAKQSQMPTDTQRRPARISKHKKVSPQLSRRRNTSGIVGVCPFFDDGVQHGWVAYYQKDGTQRRKKFRFSEFGDSGGRSFASRSSATRRLPKQWHGERRPSGIAFGLEKTPEQMRRTGNVCRASEVSNHVSGGGARSTVGGCGRGLPIRGLAGPLVEYRLFQTRMSAFEKTPSVCCSGGRDLCTFPQHRKCSR